MAAGGPVLAPRSNAWLMTPLAPHGGSLPPLVLGGESQLELEIAPGFAGARVEIDGRQAEIDGGPYAITLRQDFATLVRLGEEEDFITGLRRRRILIDSPRVMARDDRASFRSV
jgi:NAD+ kinase